MSTSVADLDAIARELRDALDCISTDLRDAETLILDLRQENAALRQELHTLCRVEQENAALREELSRTIRS
jgi:hypothetical protein